MSHNLASRRLKGLAMKSVKSTIVFAIAMLVSSAVFAADNATQPLSKADCGKAGMHWDDSANVCAASQGGSTQAVAPKAETSTKSMVPSKPAKAPEMTKPKKKKKISSKKSTSRKNIHYKKPHPTKPADHRPFRWLFPNANKKAGAS
jgi:hypothetical protein